MDTIFGSIPGFQGMCADAVTEDECRAELREALEGWILLGIANHDEIPEVWQAQISAEGFVDREKFARHLATASDQVREFATRFVVNELPTQYRYLIDLGRRNNDYPRPDGSKFPVMRYTFRASTETCLGPLVADGVLDFLWRDGAVPRWIDMNVRMADEAYTYLGLMFAGDFHVDEDRLYYGPSFAPQLSHETPPFQICGPWLPPGWNHRGENEKFDLHWPYLAS